MGARGPEAIPRGDYMQRAYWSKVAIGEPDADNAGLEVNVHEESVHNVHWYWLGNVHGITGITRSTYDKPARVLYSEMRPEEWDARPHLARLVSTCGDGECINPWHHDLRLRGEKALDEMAVVRGLKAGEIVARLRDSDLANAYDIWVWLLGLEDRKLLNMLNRSYVDRAAFNPSLLRKALDADEELDGSLAIPLVIALVEAWLNEEKLMTATQATRYAGEIRAKRAATRAETINVLTNKLAAARKVKPKPQRR